MSDSELTVDAVVNGLGLSVGGQVCYKGFSESKATP